MDQDKDRRVFQQLSAQVKLTNLREVNSLDCQLITDLDNEKQKQTVI